MSCDCLNASLRVGIEMLQGAAATGAEVRPAWRDPSGARPQHLFGHRLVIVAMPDVALQRDALTRQRVRHEYRLALDAGHAPCVVTQVHDVRFFRGNVNALHRRDLNTRT